MFVSNCAVFDQKKSRFIKNQEASRLDQKLVDSTISQTKNKIVNNFLLAGEVFMPKLRLREPGFTYSAYGPITKHGERIQKFKETGNLNYIYKTNQIKLVVLMMLHMLIAKIQLRELFQIRF